MSNDSDRDVGTAASKVAAADAGEICDLCLEFYHFLVSRKSLISGDQSRLIDLRQIGSIFFSRTTARSGGGRNR